jgi:hypothetical protein
MYVPDSNVLVTRFLSDQGVGEVVDFMPVQGPREMQFSRYRLPVICLRARLRLLSAIEVELCAKLSNGRGAQIRQTQQRFAGS